MFTETITAHPTDRVWRLGPLAFGVVSLPWPSLTVLGVSIFGRVFHVTVEGWSALGVGR